MVEPDLRPGPSLVGRRSIRHWTPNYVSHRVRALVDHWRDPHAPSLTKDATRLLGQLLAGSDQGVEWGSGNSTAWLAERTKHLTSFETNPEYFARVREGLRSRDITNVDYRLIPFQDSDSEEEMLRSEWVQSASAFIDDSLDFVLVDSSPRGCLCAQVAGKLRRGGILVLDNANWYLPPPRWLTPAPGSVSVPLGFQGSRVPESTMSPRFLDETKKWRRIWTSDGVQMTLVFIKT